MGDEHWRTRKVPQVSWFINEMYNDFNVDAFSRTTIHQIGDELDGEHLLNVSKPFSPWETVKKSEKLNKPELFKLLKDSSERTFTTRVIFMKWIHLRDKKEYERIRNKEIKHILEILKKSDNCCELVRLKEKGTVVHEELISNIFEILAIGFEENSGNKMAKKIWAEFKKNKGYMKYKTYDPNLSWISLVSKEGTPVPWHPLVFYVCANIYECVVSIQANDTDEYRIYPETVANKQIIKFARVELSKYVCLKREQETFDRKTAVGFYTSFKQQMEDTMKGQLLVMSGDQNTNNKDLVKKHSNCFNELVRKEKDMHEKVSSLELSLGKAEEQRQEAEEQRQEAIKQIKETIEQKDKAIEQKEEAIEQKQEAIEQKLESERAYDQLSDMFDELCARKAKLDQVTKQKRQQRDLSEVSHNGNPDKQEDMNHAQVCSTNPVQVTTQDNQKPKKENEITLVDI